MELVIGRGLKCSYFLVPRTSTIPIKLPTFFCKCPITANRQIQNLARHLGSSYQSINFNLFNRQHDRTYESGLLACKINALKFSTSTKSEPATKTEVPNKDCNEAPAAAEEKKTVFQKMKQLAKDYWHILIPVHIVTSIGWASVFYIAAKNGVDIIGILESLHLSESYLEMLRGSNAGHWAVTYALYKVFTPVRYTVTVGGTTMCIRYLNRWGYLKYKNPKPASTEILPCAINQVRCRA
ncbi:protein FAM210A isoform X2 [Nasonia vitripennis]|uniref:DUF1279 domain-containing protein n=1 Tax=Nasonia vitripennis TaxID=7425 RepID=A0A7M7G5Z7_NASVI|nr:protein FAM210A isoform X2 [Nasonia vitripennis]